MKRASLVFDNIQAQQQGEDRHPRTVMLEMAHRQEFTITESAQQAAADTWTFEVETCAHQLPTFPAFIAARPHR